ncbi:acyltransferase family protein [Chitinophaga caseinilytica]|uniref:acyltransferase family protein n=1 Tax=Chitinophaga caseinilytica TaxID=2267521 RepID=UPI003C2E1F5B
MKTPVPSFPSNRLLSLDVMRGWIMILLAAESAQLYRSLRPLAKDSWAEGIVRQFFHHAWNGLRFWDLVQPAFMTIAGAAMYIAFTRKGVAWGANWPHVLRRSFRLLVCGVGLHCIYQGRLVWELWNVLTQLSVTTIIAYAIIQKSIRFQIIASVALLVLTELCYRTIGIPGFDQPFTDQHNFGNWMDLLLMGKMNSGGWVTINCIPTAAHTIWGVLIGKILIDENITQQRKVTVLFAAGAIALAVGYGLDWAGITPIIKRIATSSFVLASGGWVLWTAAFLFWLIDVKKRDGGAWVPVVVGMNPIFIYLVFETVGHQWLNGAVAIFVTGFLGWTGITEDWMNVASALVTLGLYWGLCYWLYRKKIFFKL